MWRAPRVAARVPRVCAPARGEDAARARPGAGAARRRPRGGAVGPRMPPAPGAVKSQGHKSAFSPLKVKVSGLPRPVIATQLPPHLPAEARPGWAASPPVPGAGGRTPFPCEGCRACSRIIPLFLPQPRCKTTVQHYRNIYSLGTLVIRRACPQINTVQKKKTNHHIYTHKLHNGRQEYYNYETDNIILFL